MATPYRSDDLIADARERAETLRRVFPDDGEVRDDARLIDRLADALEAAESRATEAEAALNAVGSCWDHGPKMIVPEGECAPEPPLCELPSGHPGAHRGGNAEWMHRDPFTVGVAERDAALAVIENVRGLVEMWEWIPERGDVLEALSSVPADVLRERDRRVRAEALRNAADAWGADPDAWGDNDKDYRNELRDRADRIEQNSEGNET